MASSIEGSDQAQNVKTTDLLHPEVFNKHMLLTLLRRKHVKCDSTLDVDDLLQIFNKTLLPLPQRMFRDNRRGRKINKQRKRNLINSHQTEIKLTTSTTVSSSSKKICNNFRDGRLKAAPQTLNSTERNVDNEMNKVSSLVKKDVKTSSDCNNDRCKSDESKRTDVPSSKTNVKVKIKRKSEHLSSLSSSSSSLDVSKKQKVSNCNLVVNDDNGKNSEICSSDKKVKTDHNNETTRKRKRIEWP